MQSSIKIPYIIWEAGHDYLPAAGETALMRLQSAYSDAAIKSIDPKTEDREKVRLLKLQPD